MRKTCRLVGVVLTVVMMLTILNSIAMADTEVVAQGTTDAYVWTYNTDCFLSILCKDFEVDLKNIDNDILETVKTVCFDISELDYDADDFVYKNMFFLGSGCAAKKIVYTGFNAGIPSIIGIGYFQDAEEIVFEADKPVEMGTLTLLETGCSNLKISGVRKSTYFSIEASEKVTGIDLSFYIDTVNIKNCANLKDIKLNDSVTSVYISGCSSLTDLKIPDNYCSLNIKDCNMTEITIPKGVHLSISTPTLKTATLQQGRNHISTNMFYNCTALSAVNVPDGVKTIYQSAFYNCSSLSKISLPDSLERIGQTAFALSGLEKLTLPDNVNRVIDRAFYKCKSLKTVYIPVSLTEISVSAFDACQIEDVYYAGSEEQWNAITVDNDPYTSHSVLNMEEVFGSATIHFNSLKPGWAKDGGSWFYVLENGTKAVSWNQIDGKWYFFNDDGTMITGWEKINGYWYLFDNDGVMQTGWKQDNGSWYYLDPGTGAMATGWKKVNGNWYFFDNNSGAMCSNIALAENDKVYVLTSSGTLANGWYKIGQTWYYCGSDGVAAEGWKKIDGKWYFFFREVGAMASNCWVKDNGKWYFFNDDGTMVTGWKQLGEYWYYFKSSGEMAANEYCNGYWLDADGKLTYQYVAKWTKNSTGWWYGDTSGWYAKNCSLTIDGKIYNFNASGYCTNP